MTIFGIIVDRSLQEEEHCHTIHLILELFIGNEDRCRCGHSTVILGQSLNLIRFSFLLDTMTIVALGQLAAEGCPTQSHRMHVALIHQQTMNWH